MRLDTTINEDAGASWFSEGQVLPEGSLSVRERAGRLEQFLVAGLSVLLTFEVLAFGGTEEWSVTILEVGAALLFFVWMWTQISAGRVPLRLSPLYVPAIVFGLIVAAQVVFGLSAYAHVTRLELWKYAAYGSLLVLASNLTEGAARRLLTTLGIFGAAVAFFSLIQYLSYDGKIYWIWPALSTGFGPYVDHSHYAGMMELLTPIPFAMAVGDKVQRQQQVLWTLGGVLMAATIFLSGSRGGMLAFAVQGVFFIGLFLSRKNWRRVWPLLAICVAIGSLVFWIDDGRVLNKLDSFRDPLANSGVISRLDIARDVPKMVRDRPLTGWGLGLFPIVYPQYRSFSTDLVVNQAHNDYLQALVETGILGFACVVWFIVNLYRSGMRNFGIHSRLASTRALAALAGCTGILVHSVSDFNLHIPANAALFFVLCGIATERPETRSAD